jgi:hypothetical protein
MLKPGATPKISGMRIMTSCGRLAQNRREDSMPMVVTSSWRAHPLRRTHEAAGGNDIAVHPVFKNSRYGPLWTTT